MKTNSSSSSSSSPRDNNGFHGRGSFFCHVGRSKKYPGHTGIQGVKQDAFHYKKPILKEVRMTGNACNYFVFFVLAPRIVFFGGGAFYSREERDSCRNLLLEHLRFPHLCICVQTKRGERVILYITNYFYRDTPPSVLFVTQLYYVV